MDERETLQSNEERNATFQQNRELKKTILKMFYKLLEYEGNETERAKEINVLQTFNLEILFSNYEGERIFA